MSHSHDPAERARLALKRPDLLREAAWINGAWVTGETLIEVTNPATGKVLGVVPALGEAETQDAVAAAAAAFPAWAARWARVRSQFLRRLYVLVLTHRDVLAR
ncbi:MAG: aldehyde dehydrogenase family protein, partial [Brevundimonas sp.]|nr:aldehyde dehydrogenase family protein [Brevundimonas sp.]